MKKILLVDDEKGVVAMMKSYFEMSGYPAPDRPVPEKRLGR